MALTSGALDPLPPALLAVARHLRRGHCLSVGAADPARPNLTKLAFKLASTCFNLLQYQPVMADEKHAGSMKLNHNKDSTRDPDALAPQ